VSVLVGLATIAGFILLVIPGSWIGVRLAVRVEALVVEGRRGTQAMGRSWALVGGHWWHAFGALVVAGLLTGVVNAVITSPFNNTGWLVQAVAAAVATVITMPYGCWSGCWCSWICGPAGSAWTWSGCEPTCRHPPPDLEAQGQARTRWPVAVEGKVRR
jgi:hypothetical protein